MLPEEDLANFEAEMESMKTRMAELFPRLNEAEVEKYSFNWIINRKRDQRKGKMMKERHARPQPKPLPA